MNREMLKEMFNFTKNKKETIKVGNLIFLQMFIYGATYPFIMQYIVDKAITEKNIKVVISLSVILLLIVFIRSLIDGYTETKRKYCYHNNDYEIKNKIFNSVQDANISEIDKIQVGTLMGISTSQSYEASQLFVWSFIGALCVRFATTLLISIILLLLNWKLALIIIGIFIISYIFLIPMYNKTRRIYKKLQEIIIELQANVNEYIDSFSTTKTLRLEETNLAQIDKILKNSKKEIMKSDKVISIHNAIFSILTFTSILAIVLVGGNELNLGIGVASTIMLMVNYVDDINRHIKSLLEHVHKANNRYNCFLNILKTVNIKKEEDKGTKSLSNIEKVEFRDVSLSYDGRNTILDKINFKVTKPMQIAVVGKSGAGKTSLVNLLPRFYEICKGSILINGIDYRDIQLKELRNHIAYVFQEPVIFEKTILNNIKFGNSSNIKVEQIIEVCKRLGIHEKIKQFPDGYETLISAKTDLLSYGEKQLLSFARAILKDADLIILDEVTSNLDFEFEEKVMKATKEMLSNKISFVIAHRLNTIKNSDLILFIDNTNIVEMGTHEELIQKEGYYYNLYNNTNQVMLTNL